MAIKNPMGANSFDRLHEAGILGAKAPTEDQVRSKLEAKIERLRAIDGHLAKVELATAKLYAIPKDKQLKQLTAAMNATVALATSKGLPVGSKAPLTACANELTSLREGVWTGAATDRRTLTVLFASKARKDIADLIEAALSRKEKMLAESQKDSDLDEFYKMADEVIKKNAGEADKLMSIKDKAFVIARAPVVPADAQVNVEKLKRAGVKCESLAGYAVIHNQLVIGINGTKLPKGVKAPAEAERLRKGLEKQMGTKLQFVSPKAAPYKGGAWFWLMSDRDLEIMARAFPGGQIKVSIWGMAFN